MNAHTVRFNNNTVVNSPFAGISIFTFSESFADVSLPTTSYLLFDNAMVTTTER